VLSERASPANLPLITLYIGRKKWYNNIDYQLMAEKVMIFKNNPELIEKPDHLHYPICRGRLEEINQISTRILKFTIGAAILMAAVSLLGAPLHVVGWLPMMFTMKDIEFGMGGGFCITQALISLLLIVFAALGCTERKIFDVLLCFAYMAMLVCSIFIHLSIFDAFTFIIGLAGTLYSFGILKGYIDFKQLRKTEGYPIFSVSLAEYDDRKKNSPDGYYRDHYDELVRQRLMQQRQGSQPANMQQGGGIKSFSQAQSDSGGLGDMPELNISKPVMKKAAPDRFVSKSGKESKVLFSELKLR